MFLRQKLAIRVTSFIAKDRAMLGLPKNRSSKNTGPLFTVVSSPGIMLVTRVSKKPIRGKNNSVLTTLKDVWALAI